MGRPGGAGVKAFEFRGLHLVGGEGAALQAADRPGDGGRGCGQHRAARVGDARPPAAADLNTAHPGINDFALAAPWGGLVLLAAHALVLEQLQPVLLAWSLSVLAMGGQSGQRHRPGAVEAQLQVAAVEQGIETGHGNGQQQQLCGCAGSQAPAAVGEFRCAAAGQQISGHTAAGARRHHVGGFRHQARQGKKGGLGLAGPCGLRERSAAREQLQGHRSIPQRSCKHRQPQG